jgi:transposase
VDESGFMLQPTVRRTWSPRGQTPIHYSWDRRERLSVISAITLSPQRRRLGLYFRLFDHNIIADDAAPFVAAVLGHFPCGIILVWDRWMVHRSAARRLQERFPRRFDVEWLPPYAPDLNPTEQVWNRTKNVELPNYIPDDIVGLAQKVHNSLGRQQKQTRLLRSYFKHAKLELQNV